MFLEILVVLILVGGLGYFVYKKIKDKKVGTGVGSPPTPKPRYPVQK